MAEINRESSPVGPVTAVGSPGGEIGAPSPPERVSRPAGGSRSPSHAMPEVAVPDLGKVLEGLTPHQNIGLTYVIDRETHSVIIKVIDRETNEVVREIPSEEMTKLRAAMREFFGILFKAQA